MEKKDKVSFKVYLKTAGSELEVRRFLIERNTRTDYNLLMEKLWMLFPQLQDSDFSLTWTDSEGDTITVNTNEELSIALTEMPGEPYKLHLTIKSSAPTWAEKWNNLKGVIKIVKYIVHFHPCPYQQIPDLGQHLPPLLSTPLSDLSRIYENVRFEPRQPWEPPRAPDSTIYHLLDNWADEL